MAVLAFKMISGQEIVAEATPGFTTLNSKSPSYYLLTKAHVLQIQGDGRGGVGLVLIPWFLSSPDARNVEVQLTHIVAIVTPDPQVEKQYLSQTSGISLDTTV